MRRSIILPSTLLCICAALGVAYAQGDLLLRGVELLDPNLSATVVVSKAAGNCAGPGIDPWSMSSMEALTCTIQGVANQQGSAVMADGTLLRWVTVSQSPDPTCDVPTSDYQPYWRYATRFFATSSDGTTRELLRVDTYRALDCDGVQARQLLTSGSVYASFDVTNGRLLIYMIVVLNHTGDGGRTWQETSSDSGIIEVRGLPTMFDTLLSFVPGGQSISAVTPAHPDGFRAADSLQLWTGNLHTLSDWSRAEPLACNAVTNPVPGQVVTVADTLPDPAPGDGRYYVIATQRGGDRRLGRQFVNGGFSARDPAALPVCR